MYVAEKSPFNEVAALLAILALGVPGIAGAEDALERCSLIDDDGARLACYDEISGRTSSPLQDSAPDAPVVVAPPPATTEVKEAPANTARQNTRTARVTACSSNVSDQLVFHLDNGEVWKQSNYKNLKLGECDFTVTLSRGMMGYKMRIDQTGKSFRVARVK
ncbi:MAG: hypothetical protein HKN64_00505 [Woeseiaceae bacterium]|nr:hypothetical protein [Woeseiaceae bacterium]